ncbi:50S ribosomal protein L25/general stress protein Ctc [Natranaerobius thermophilus]|uniref:Large ribosomal subunit protein bL25 n=1 Tax=Natranaerobius thermophilus (strain ATCC BAA-1301 / DSM 18059 / JW/NM-WN-LF) TaxID=457570 RepID=RL25_NATTJ|nr:50S ribosomal protein L25/general stress protein Ctc [Natranaerobius thermophilus]B2A3N5.1 RecName: Full=Large ribosomal subunit protein bL25; AltName: Full=50S ribosomal protein L25; AltName: Full=General stress protein CTC [Natranaerobius thermophilus JW/NM-WN-LF]ACB83661.1 ribosomal 5S rRNA E-loop binding protein Ctc/L25/TL5 [Natranaerobius thermophilus JW/NM-WN-LF]
MDRKELQVKERTVTRKSEVKKLRTNNEIPAVLYGKNIESKKLSIEKRELLDALSTAAGDNVLLDLKLDNGESYPAIFKEIQKDPIKGFFIHIDFHTIDLKETLQVSVPLNIEGEPVGVENGGIPQYQLREIEIECLPTQIPDHIEVDVSNIDLNESINVGDLPLPEGSELVTEPEETVMSVVAPETEEEPDTEEDEEGEEDVEEESEEEEEESEE